MCGNELTSKAVAPFMLLFVIIKGAMCCMSYPLIHSQINKVVRTMIAGRKKHGHTQQLMNGHSCLEPENAKVDGAWMELRW